MDAAIIIDDSLQHSLAKQLDSYGFSKWTRGYTYYDYRYAVLLDKTMFYFNFPYEHVTVNMITPKAKGRVKVEHELTIDDVNNIKSIEDCIVLFKKLIEDILIIEDWSFLYHLNDVKDEGTIKDKFDADLILNKYEW